MLDVGRATRIVVFDSFQLVDVEKLSDIHTQISGGLTPVFVDKIMCGVKNPR
jgi:hypothetical protein